jgi:glycosyltransferase involved in cell wall biosynthesis
MQRPLKASLVVALYNRKEFVAQAIDSILAQTEKDFELLIWDDGSTDGSSEIAQAYAANDARVRYVRTENEGFTMALKRAIAQTSAPLLGWVDSDDYLHPEALAKTIAALEEDPALGMVYTQYQDVDSSGKVLGLGRRCSATYFREQMLMEFLTFHFRLIRRSVYEQVGGIDTSFYCAQDYDLCLKLSEVTEVRIVAEPLYFYRQHAQSISRQRRMEQIECSRRAVENALIRRGMADEWALGVEIRSL